MGEPSGGTDGGYSRVLRVDCDPTHTFRTHGRAWRAFPDGLVDEPRDGAARNYDIRASVIIPEQTPAPTAIAAMIIETLRRDSIIEASGWSRVSVLELECRMGASETLSDAARKLG